jgi:hypothetical protein
MIEEKPGLIRFGEALGTGVNSAFTNLRNEIMKSGAISSAISFTRSETGT